MHLRDRKYTSCFKSGLYYRKTKESASVELLVRKLSQQQVNSETTSKVPLREVTTFSENNIKITLIEDKYQNFQNLSLVSCLIQKKSTPSSGTGQDIAKIRTH